MNVQVNGYMSTSRAFLVSDRYTPGGIKARLRAHFPAYARCIFVEDVHFQASAPCRAHNKKGEVELPLRLEFTLDPIAHPAFAFLRPSLSIL